MRQHSCASCGAVLHVRIRTSSNGGTLRSTAALMFSSGNASYSGNKIHAAAITLIKQQAIYLYISHNLSFVQQPQHS